MIVVDASVWISLMLDRDAHHVVTDSWFQGIQSSHQSLCAPHLLLPEVSGAVARRMGSASLGMAAVRELRALQELDLVPIDDELAVRATRLAAELRLRGADAVYVAVAELLGLPLVTWDQELATRAAAAIQVREPAID